MMKLCLLLAVAASLSSTTEARIGASINVDLTPTINTVVNELVSKGGGDNEYAYCVWNDWAARDQIARIQRTYDNCRFSRRKRTFFFKHGRIYCTYKQAACKAFGQQLD